MGTVIWMHENSKEHCRAQVRRFHCPLLRFQVRRSTASSCAPAGIRLEPSTLAEFMTSLTSSPHSRAISFAEFRDFFLLLPREASTKEIYRYYQVKRSAGGDNRGAARLTMDGTSTSVMVRSRPGSS